MTSSAESNFRNQRQQEKTDLRRRLLKARQAIPKPVWQQKSDRICNHLWSWPGFQTARGILSYWSFRNEPDLSSLMNDQRLWGLPRCNGKNMSWHQWQGTQTLQPGRFGITEPIPELPQLDPAQVDLILVPAVACDVRGYRLGYGGGFYDRMLSKPQWRRQTTIAIVFEYARLPTIPKDSWDRPLQGICTETGLYLSNRL
ncbi:MAG: 5-formyltetrahydrofolate cyclo-ligase [Leptolyngbya sp. SIO1D8]|nr:5-formyltetrahydrofolate cyclo-ligase [Leptolyngbya sp. SIO1D8]